MSTSRKFPTDIQLDPPPPIHNWMMKFSNYMKPGILEEDFGGLHCFRHPTGTHFQGNGFNWTWRLKIKFTVLFSNLFLNIAMHSFTIMILENNKL